MKKSLLLALTVVVVLTIASCGPGSETTTLKAPLAARRVTMNVLFPPNNPDVQKYLMTNEYVDGVDIAVNWSDIDKGNGQYSFTIPDAAIAPWVAAKKTINLVVWANSDSAAGSIGNVSVPTYVWQQLGPSNYVNCVTQAGTQRLPNYLNPIWIKDYEAAITAITDYYSGKVGYIRFGLGHGGETLPAAGGKGGWNDLSSDCGKSYAKWGLTIPSWENYLKTLLDYEATARASLQRMVGVTPLGSPNTEVPDYVASVASPLGTGFGSQGLEASDLQGCQYATADWCNLFKKYATVPHELQTIGQSCPSGKGCTGQQAETGPLPPLLVFGKANGATIFEIYYEDWLLAFNPAASGYSQYGVSYAAAIKTASGR